MASKKQRKRRKRRPPAAPAPAAPAAAEPAPVASRRRALREEERPLPLWGSFPLSEIVIAIGILLLIGGLFVEPPRGKIIVGVGLVLGALAGLEVAAREHFAGYRSHTSLLAGGAGVASVAIVLAVGRSSIPVSVGLAIGLAVGGLAAVALVRAFRRASGGASFKLR
jgi:hypothetical protein